MRSKSTSSESKKGGNISRKVVIGVVCATLVVAVGVIAVFAYLSGKSGPVTNQLKADPDPTVKINETVATAVPGTTDPDVLYDIKKDVTVTLDSNSFSAYVRAAIVVNWVDKDGNVFATKPTENDYILKLNLPEPPNDDLAAGQWRLGKDNFYYYTSPVIDGGTTEILIEEARVADGVIPPAGYSLSVQIAAQTIQAIGTTDTDDVLAVVDAWGVTTTKVDGVELITK